MPEESGTHRDRSSSSSRRRSHGHSSGSRRRSSKKKSDSNSEESKVLQSSFLLVLCWCILFLGAIYWLLQDFDHAPLWQFAVVLAGAVVGFILFYKQITKK